MSFDLRMDMLWIHLYHEATVMVAGRQAGTRAASWVRAKSMDWELILYLCVLGRYPQTQQAKC